MKKIKWGAIIASAAFIAACSKDDSKDNAAVKDGLCTGATVDAYNAISNAQFQLRISRNATKSDVQNIVNACASYKGLIAGNSCKAAINGVETTVSASSQDAICNAADSAMLQIQQQEARVQQPTQNVCSSLVVMQYNEIISGAKNVNATTSMTDLKMIQQDCSTFQYIAPAESCEAESNGKTLTINRDSTKMVCQKIDDVINAYAVPSGDKKPLVTIVGMVKVTILDQAKVDLLTSGILVAQGGKVVDMTQAYGENKFDVNLPYCSMFSATGKLTKKEIVLAGFKVSLSGAVESSSADLGAAGLTLTCWNGSDTASEDMSLNTLKTTFKSLLDFTVL